jgi:3-oxoacyl-[acyl-carrier protein] reductase
MDLGLNGRTAIITGGSLGIGRAVTVELAHEGANVVCAARSEENLQQTATLAKGALGEVLTLVQDCSTSDAPARVVAAAKQRFGRVDILVNNLGTGWLGHGWDTPDETWEFVMNFNLFSAVRFAREVIPLMQENGWGRIINMSSVSGHSGFPAMGDYNASKAAMIMWSKTISRELAPEITVNSICPACIDTPLWENLADQLKGVEGESVQEVYENVAAKNLVMGRYGTSEEVAGLVAYVASDRAAFLTGACLNIDGGFTKFAY